MSFVRKKLSSVWGRSSDVNSPSSQENYPTSISSGDSEYSSNINPSLLGSISEVSPGRLHKVASTAFQAFSDSIRAKTHIFYANPGKTEPAGSDSPEAKTPRKHGQRAPIWSSARKRQGLTDRTNHAGAADDPGTPNASQGKPAEPAPSLDVKIPSSSLTELRTNDGFTAEPSVTNLENQTARNDSYAPRRLWPSQHMAPPGSPIVHGSINPATRSSLMDDPYTESSYEVAYDSSMFEPCRSAFDAGHHVGKNDEGYTLGLESISDHVESDSVSPTSIASSCYLTSPTGIIAKSPHNHSSLFVKGDQARVRLRQTPSPFRKAKQSQESPLAGATTGDTRPDSSLEAPVTVIRSDLWMPNFPNEPIGTARGLFSSSSPLVHRSSSFEKDLGCSAPDSNAIEAAEVLGYSRLPSHVYEADAESAASSPGTPNMGSRHAWNETRADRNDRYLAIHTMSETTHSDENSDPELGLSRSPLRKLIHSPKEDSGVSIIEGYQQVRLDSPEHSDTELKRSPSKSSLQTKLEALELLESSCDPSTDSESRTSSPPEPTLRFYLEANNRVSGTVLDDFETPASAFPGEAPPYIGGQIKYIVDSARAGLDSYVVESPEQNPGLSIAVENAFTTDKEALETSVLASSSDEGRQSYENIQEVTNTGLDDAEFQDVVQRTNKLHQLHLQHHYSLQKRIYDRESGTKTSKACKEDVFMGSSRNAESLVPGSNVTKEASSNAFFHAGNDKLSHLFRDPDVVGDNEILDLTIMDRENRVSFDLAEDADASPPLQKLQSGDQEEALTDALRGAGMSRRSLEKGKVFRGNPSNTPVEYSRSFSAESVRTTDSCAVTTSSPLYYAPPPFPTLHVRSSPVRRTSSIIAGLEAQDDQADKDPSTEPRADRHGSTPEVLETIVRELLNFENCSSPSEHDISNASPSPATLGSSLAARTNAQLMSIEYLESPEPIRHLVLDQSSSTYPVAPEPLLVSSTTSRKLGEQALPFRLREDEDEEPPKEEAVEPSPKKVRLDNETQVLGEATGNKCKKRKSKKRKNRKSKSVDASLEPVKSKTVPPLGKALGSMVLDVSSPTSLRPIHDEYQTSSHEKGVWWARDQETVAYVESPLAEKVLEKGKKRMEGEEMCVVLGGETTGRISEYEGDEKLRSGVKEGVSLG